MRILSSVLATALVVTAIPAAFANDPTLVAATSSTSSSSVSIPTLPDPCASKIGKARGKCISDILKGIAREEKAFAQKQRQDRDTWRDTYDSMGLTPEYRKLLQDFVNSQLAERKSFELKNMAIRKSIDTDRQDILSSRRAGRPSSVSSSSSSYQKSSVKLNKDCSALKSDRARRACGRTSR